ncbi:sulfatase [Stieleria varia]
MPAHLSLFRPAAFLAFLVLGSLATNTTVVHAAPPNVLFLICDDLNCDIGCYGHPQVKTPNIDRLAARGVRFESAHCQYPLCGPSRASFMTGLYPDQTRIKKNAIYVREHLPNVKTLSEAFRDAGYFATRIGKIYHYNVPKHIGTSGHDDPYSWNDTFNPRGRDVDDEDQIFSLVPGTFGGTLSWLAAEGTDAEQTDGIAAAEAARRLNKHASDKHPFFLAVGLYRPHTPYVAPKDYFAQYPLDQIKIPSVPDGYDETIPKPALQSIRRKRDQVNLKPELAAQAIQAYYASITFADAQLGLILDALDESGLADNTIVLFTSDHGYHMGEHGHYQKTTLFENATHVPLIISAPGIPGGTVAKTMAEMVDFYPTLTQLAGVDAPNDLSGRSLVPALQNPETMVRDSALSHFSQSAPGYSIRTAKYRYTFWGDDGSAGEELYELSTDSDEMHNLAGETKWDSVRSELKQLLRQRIIDAQKIPRGVNVFDVQRTKLSPQ